MLLRLREVGEGGGGLVPYMSYISIAGPKDKVFEPFSLKIDDISDETMGMFRVANIRRFFALRAVIHFIFGLKLRRKIHTLI